MKITFFALVLLILNACNQKRTTESLITNDNYRYWSVSKDTTEKSKAENYYYFDKNGKWLVFQKRFNKSNFDKLDRGDIYFIETWRLINDSTIEIGTRLYHIVKITDDEFIFLSKESGFKRRLIAVPENIIPAHFQRMQ